MAVRSLDEISAPHERIAAALDQRTWTEARDGLSEYGSAIGIAKVNSVADAIGSERAVQEIGDLGALTMLDWKFHDVDDTMYRRAYEAARVGASIITIMASNSTKAMKEAVRGVDDAVKEFGLTRPWLAGVTVLTSISDEEFDAAGQPLETCTSIYGADRMTKVGQFGNKAAEAGLDAAVCSPKEAAMLRNGLYTKHLKLILPAIRPLYVTKSDEQAANALTPTRAIEAGGDLLVVGRPITEAHLYGLTGLEAANVIAEEIGKAQ